MPIYLISLIASLYLLSILILAWQIATAWSLSRYAFFLALYLFLVLLATVGLLAIVKLPDGPWWGISGIILLTLCIRKAQHLIKPSKQNKASFWRFVLLAVICLGLAGQGSLVYQQYKDEKAKTAAVEIISQQTARLNRKSQQAYTLAKSLSTDTNLLDYIDKNNLSALNPLLQQYLNRNSLGFLVLADSQGKIIGSPHFPQLNNEGLFERFPWTSSLKQTESTTLKGLALNEKELPLAVGGLRATPNNKPAFILLLGYALNKQYLEEADLSNDTGLSLGAQTGLITYASQDNFIQAALNSADLSDLYLNKLVQHSNQVSKLKTKEKNYLLVSQRLQTLDAETPLYMLSLKDETKP